MKLEDIGFYALSDRRAKYSGICSPLYRCELILTTACNFKCKYCKPLQPTIQGTMSYEKAESIVARWCDEGLRNIRFSGGEPTLWPGLIDLVEFAKCGGIRRIAVSTNGSASKEMYEELIGVGVDDFSIYLDACCASDGDTFAGGIVGAWDTVVSNIKYLSGKVYTTVGVVITNENLKDLPNIIKFASSLGVADIRIISAAQFNYLDKIEIDKKILKKHPILAHRIKNLNRERGVRGLKDGDSSYCSLVLDDMAIAGNYHFPCIIALREGHKPIGAVGNKSMIEIRKERQIWMLGNCTHLNKVCKNNCLDVCIDFNNKADWRVE